MPFTDEQIVVEKKSRFATPVLIITIGLFALSLFNFCFYTKEHQVSSYEALLFGWFALLADKASLTWFANPFLIISWILLSKNKNSAWIFGLLAALISFSFLKFHVIIKDEAGNSTPIIKIGLRLLVLAF